MQINFVCVYSASSTKIDAVYFQAAETLGRLLAEHRIRLINGAGSIGLMCSVADAVLKNGGEVTGVIPRFMVEQNWHHTGPVSYTHLDVYKRQICCFMMI